MTIEVKKNNLEVKEKNIIGYYTADVVASGNSARINCQKKYMGKKVLVVILEDEKQ